MSITRKSFGVTKDGKEASLYTLCGEKGLEATVTDFGAILVSLVVPEHKGGCRDVVLGYDTLKEYEESGGCLGSTVGRHANRIGGAKFSLDGVEYHLVVNDKENNLHTDKKHGFHKVMWKGSPDEAATAVKFTYLSPDGENGFPGNLTMSVTYSLLEDGIQIDYDGVSDKKTVINVTNHSYFNLGGHDSGSIEDERLTLKASGFTEIYPGAIPTGRILPVEGTPMDFRTARRIGDDVDADWEQLKLVGGYDHNWVLDTEFGRVEKFAQLEDDRSRLTMDANTDLPGVQVYTANGLSDRNGKGGARYARREAVCLETQYFPNSVNIPSFRQPVFDAGQHCRTTTVYRFR
ncbi:MAG: galactose mutarotase [Lachnospiraceae bacterium]|nr:galactose mutarotase [Lachnospiraceae bacterium]